MTRWLALPVAVAATATPADLIEMEMAAINRQTHHAQQARLLDARQRRGRR